MSNNKTKVLHLTNNRIFLICINGLDWRPRGKFAFAVLFNIWKYVQHQYQTETIPCQCSFLAVYENWLPLILEGSRLSSTDICVVWLLYPRLNKWITGSAYRLDNCQSVNEETLSYDCRHFPRIVDECNASKLRGVKQRRESGGFLEKCRKSWITLPKTNSGSL